MYHLPPGQAGALHQHQSHDEHYIGGQWVAPA